VRGSLRREFELFVRQLAQQAVNPVPRHQIAWADAKAHLRTAFLAIDEGAYLRGELEKMRQSPYETVASYNRRFRDIATVAFPPPHNADQVRIMLEAYKRGLSSIEVVRELTLRNHPANVDQAMTAALAFAAGEDEFTRITHNNQRTEEPMEIGGIGNNTSHNKSCDQHASRPVNIIPDTTLPKMIKSLTSTVDKLANKIDSIERSQLQQPTYRPRNQSQITGSGNPRWPRSNQSPSQRRSYNQTTFNQRPQNPPVCFACHQPGHFKNNCPFTSSHLQPPSIRPHRRPPTRPSYTQTSSHNHFSPAL